MGISFSCPFANFDDLDSRLESFLARSLSFGDDGVSTVYRSISFNSRDTDPATMKPVGANRMIIEGSLSFNGRDLDTMLSFTSSSMEKEDRVPERSLQMSLPPLGKRHQAALRLQKTYKSFRTRRQLADCAVLVEQRWWKLLDFAELKHSSISFFEIEKPETAVSRWARARTRAAKVGKGLSKDEKARKLALQHWLEAIDPRHRYGHNLQFYYAKWLHCNSKQPFFYWLDIGEGKEVNLDRCPRSKLQQQCIKYLGPIEREAYEVALEDGKFMYKQSEKLIDTREGPEDAKWIFVLSASKVLYIGQKKKGTFQHSSFLAGGATLSAGRVVIEDGVLKAVWPHSGHYLPTEENFEAFILFLEENNVDLKTVQKNPGHGDMEEAVCAIRATSIGIGMRNSISEPDFARASEETDAKSSDKGENVPRKQYSKDAENLQRPPLSQKSEGFHSKITALEIPKREDIIEMFKRGEQPDPASSSDGYETAEEYLSDIEFTVSKRNLFDEDEEVYEEPILKEKIMERINSHKGMRSYQLAQQLSCKWTTGAGPRIGCVRDYPSELQFRVMEEVSLSPRSAYSSPRRLLSPSPRVTTPSSLCRETTPAKKSPLGSEPAILS